MTKTILSALALAVAISFASCSNKKACNNKQDAAATQANDTANAASNNQEQADGSAKYTDFALHLMASACYSLMWWLRTR